MTTKQKAIALAVVLLIQGGTLMCMALTKQ